jgi:hypothetical protein
MSANIPVSAATKINREGLSFDLSDLSPSRTLQETPPPSGTASLAAVPKRALHSFFPLTPVLQALILKKELKPRGGKRYET